MPVAELGVDYDQLAELTAKSMEQADAEHWRRHAKKRRTRAFSAVFDFPYRLDRLAGGSLRSMVDPGAYIAIPSEGDHTALVERASSAAARPFQPSGGTPHEESRPRRRRRS
jgi:hypothetical protein